MKFKSTKYICCNCKKHYWTAPNIYGLEVKGDGCDNCGCTSFKGTRGRIISKKSRWYKELLDCFNRIKNDLPKEIIEEYVC